MSQIIQHTPPQDFPGDPYENAEAAVRQLQAIYGELVPIIEATALMARNASLQRDLDQGLEPNVDNWTGSVAARQLELMQKDSQHYRERLVRIAQSAGWNPKTPLGRA